MAEAPWHARVDCVEGSVAWVTLRREGSMDLAAGIELDRWGLEDAQPGDILVLDTTAQSVTRLEARRWTQEELDATWREATEMSRRMFGLDVLD